MNIGVDSGCQLVPDASRDSGISSGVFIATPSCRISGSCSTGCAATRTAASDAATNPPVTTTARTSRLRFRSEQALAGVRADAAHVRADLAMFHVGGVSLAFLRA